MLFRSVTVAASMFPRTMRRVLSHPDDVQAASSAELLHRICRIYAGIGIAVPIFGFATASVMGVLGSVWLIISITLTAAAAFILAAVILPGQAGLLQGLQASPAQTGPAGQLSRVTVQLAMITGIFNLLWATVTVLMIIRPGSTTGA